MPTTPEIPKPVDSKSRTYAWQQVALYGATVFGVLMSPFIPHLVTIILYSEIPNVPWSVWHPVRIGAVMFVAVLMTSMIEKDGDKRGKAKNFHKRLIQHLAYGAMWSSLLESIIKGAQQ